MAEDYTLANPIDHTKVGDLPDEIRNVKALVVSGAMRFFWQSAEPTTRYEGTAFSSDDLGSIWIDSDDNVIKILTATTPTWTLITVDIFAKLLAANRTFALSEVALTLQNTDHEDGAGERQCRFIATGEDSDGNATILGFLEFSHDGTSKDDKGKVRLVLSDADDNNSPSIVPITLLSTGKIDVANSLSVLDEDDMASDDAEVLATQQSIKAYIDAQTAFSAYTNQDSDNQTMLKTHAYKAATAGFVNWTCVPGDGKNVQGFVDTDNDPASGGTRVCYVTSNGSVSENGGFAVAKDEYFELTTDGAAAITILWKSKGTLSKPIDQEA